MANPRIDLTSLDKYMRKGEAVFSIKRSDRPVNFTYKVKQIPKRKHVYFVTMKRNDVDFYDYIGTLAGYTLRLTQGSLCRSNHPYFAVFSKMLKMMTEDKKVNSNVYFNYDGTCGACGRHLKDPVSVLRGYGPTCWGRVNE